MKHKNVAIVDNWVTTKEGQIKQRQGATMNARSQNHALIFAYC